MTRYDFEDKAGFTLRAIGIELKSEYADQPGLNQEKEDFLNEAVRDGTIEKLKKIAQNDFLFFVNEAAKIPYRVEFSGGRYIAIPGEAKSEHDLVESLNQAAFGEVLNKESAYSYTGGPNAVVIMGEKEGTYVGEIWIPMPKK